MPNDVGQAPPENKTRRRSGSTTTVPTSRTIQCLVPHAELKAPLEFWPHRWQ